MQNELTIEFGKSRSPDFEEAYGLARLNPHFITIQDGKYIKYLARFDNKSLADFIRLGDLAYKWKSTRFTIESRLLDNTHLFIY